MYEDLESASQIVLLFGILDRLENLGYKIDNKDEGDPD